MVEKMSFNYKVPISKKCQNIIGNKCFRNISKWRFSNFNLKGLEKTFTNS